MSSSGLLEPYNAVGGVITAVPKLASKLTQLVLELVVVTSFGSKGAIVTELLSRYLKYNETQTI